MFSYSGHLFTYKSDDLSEFSYEKIILFHKYRIKEGKKLKNERTGIFQCC